MPTGTTDGPRTITQLADQARLIRAPTPVVAAIGNTYTWRATCSRT